MRLTHGIFALSIFLAVPAHAATVIESWTFEATTDGPFTSHSGSFSFSYDQEGPFSPTLLSVDFRIGDLVFDTSNTGIEPFDTTFVIGGLTRGIRPLRLPITETTADWMFYVIPSESYFGYVVSNSTSVYPDRELSFTRNVSTLGNPGSSPAVPEPETWAMLVLGFGIVGTALRSARARTRIAARRSQAPA
jgi:hypothetical protein